MALDNNLNDKLHLWLCRELIRQMPHGVTVSNAAGEFIFWNDMAATIFPLNLMKTRQETWVKGFGVFKIVDKTPYETNSLPVVKALSGETILHEKMLIVNEQHSSGIYLKVCSYPIWTDGVEPHIEAAVTVFEDITQEQRVYDGIISKVNELENYLREKLDFKPNLKAR